MISKIVIRPVKTFAKRKLRDFVFTEDIITSEPDAMTVQEFVTKSRIWLQLLEKELQMRRSR